MEGEDAKKTLGRRKIPMEKIEKKSNRQVTFSKRRMGLFKKASELSILCSAEIAILVQSPANKMFTFGAPTVDSVLDQFQGLPAMDPAMAQIWALETSRMKCAEGEKSLEKEKEMEKTIKETGVGFWWNEDIEGKDLDELEDYLESMEGLLANVCRRLEELTVKGKGKGKAELDNGILMPLAESVAASDQGVVESFDGGMMMAHSFLSNYGNLGS